jgi:hypothetical protein
MLIVSDDHRRRAGVCSLDELCPYCGLAFTAYPLIMSDDPGQTVYHVGCALELATDILVDLYTFFRPPAPYEPLFTLTPPQAVRNP